ncbi:Phage tail assembly chaperone protein, E, or 41 or 14 [Thiohalospira halophila DSM 15071]|uniref:Phage tail assembly chaperone protein, E, or 41 or 14 n=1 Tax=Thiohalospira halophila DSM 15071 TaxID=1123397 RepID=A0A1I1UCR3_9GAMM|nr:phage tail assembly protein [Thiohalospira halophila]SFD68527.1 Phage tail assembly chaperone protein, E, or 41 or 14 [Thiohalospira halophila DSM 15071]
MSNRVTLNDPITVDGQQVTEIELRRPKVRDQLLAEKSGGGPGEQEVSIFSNLSGLPQEAIQDLDLADYLQLQEVYRGFFD